MCFTVFMFVGCSFSSNDEISSPSKEYYISDNPSIEVEYNEYLGYSVSIKGRLQNLKRKTVYVSVTYNLYDNAGCIIGSVWDNHGDLPQNEFWQFDATVGYYGNIKPVSFKLAEVIIF